MTQRYSPVRPRSVAPQGFTWQTVWPTAWPHVWGLLMGVALVVAGYNTTRAQAPMAAKPPTPITTVEGISEYRLDNGLQVLLFPDPAAATVTVNLTVLVGSRHEGYGETGMAHLLEHMVFKGTPTHPDVPKALRDHGANFNGTTWYDRTNYFETMPATVENLEFGLALEADRLVNSWIKAEDLASEFSVVRSEFESGENNPQRVLFQRMLSAAYDWHNYGKSTIGNRTDIERVPVDRLRAFYTKYYQPDNAVLVVAGKFEPAKALELIVKHFGPLPRPTRQLEKTYTEEPAQDGERTVTLRRVGATGAVGAVYHIPAAAHPDYAALEVLADVLDNEPTGPLYKALVESKLAASAGAGTFGLHDPGVLIATASIDKPADGSDIGPVLNRASDTLVATLEGAATAGFSDEDVARSRRKLLKSYELLLTNSGQVGITLSEWAAKGDWRLFFLHRDRVEKVTTADVTRVAASYLTRNNRTTGMFIPSEKAQRATVPPTPTIAEIVGNYQGRAAVATGEAFEPTPENVEARVVRGQLPQTGLKTAVLARKTRGEMAQVRLTLRYGNETSLRGQAEAADMLADLLDRGTAKRPRQAWQDEIDKLGARVGFSGQAGLLSVSIQAKRDNLPAVVDLVIEALRQPALQADEFDTIKRQGLEGLRKSLTEPQALAGSALQRHLNPYPADDVRYIPTLEESIARLEGLTLEQVRDLYAGQLAAAHGELVLVGDFPPTVTDQFAQGLANWTSAVEFRRIPRPANTEVSGGRLIIETPDKANAVYLAAHSLAMTDADPDYPALKIADFVFGEAPLASRLSNRVRGRDGLSYGVGAQLGVSPIDKAGRFLMFAIANPANVTKVDAAIREELATMLETGMTQDELDQAKRAFLAAAQTARGSDAAIAGQLGNALFVGRTMSFEADFEARVKALTLDEVNAAFRRHIRPEKLMVVEAGDFKNAKAPVTGKPDAPAKDPK